MSISRFVIRLTGKSQLIKSSEGQEVGSIEQEGETTMQINGSENAKNYFESGFSSSKELLEDLGRFIDEVANAGVLYATDGFQPSSKAARVQLSELF